jgi:hypothetical protein
MISMVSVLGEVAQVELIATSAFPPTPSFAPKSEFCLYDLYGFSVGGSGAGGFDSLNVVPCGPGRVSTQQPQPPHPHHPIHQNHSSVYMISMVSVLGDVARVELIASTLSHVDLGAYLRSNLSLPTHTILSIKITGNEDIFCVCMW